MRSTVNTFDGAGKHHASAKSARACKKADVVYSIITMRAGFFQSAAEKTGNPVGKKMFLSMMEDERKYGESFVEVVKMLGIRVSDISHIVSKLKTFFEKNGRALLGRIRTSTDEVEAVRIAMDMEKENIELCERLSREARDPKQRAFFEGLVDEERQLYTIFSNTALFLSDPNAWLMWNEHGILDGGTPWA